MTKELWLTLSDGSRWKGQGYLPRPVEGEVVFSTASGGYPQALSDPSFCGQILVFAFPPQGIYGVDGDLESLRPWVTAAVADALEGTKAGDLEPLFRWMERSETPLVWGFDTRQIILRVRASKTLMGRLDWEAVTPAMASLPDDMVSRVSCPGLEVLGDGDLTIGVVDYGVKLGILRNLLARGCRVLRFPNSTTADELLSAGLDGLLLSNGPGDPAVLKKETQTVREVLGRLPVFGVCLGNQLLAQACGAKTKKLPYGHRGVNHPVIDVATGRSLLTSQNHQYAVDEATLEGTGLQVAFRHLGDGTIEGLRHLELDAESVQFHPEASPGPRDGSYLFDQFIARARAFKENR